MNCISESFNTNISHQIFDNKITVELELHPFFEKLFNYFGGYDRNKTCPRRQ